jgi:uncharacterized protein YjbI with pentapeptide repeats
MIETFNKIINNQSFERVGSLTVIQRKNFLNEVIRSQNLMGLTFSHLTFLDCNFIDIDFRHTNFISCDFTNCNFTETLFLKSELDDCSFKNSKIFKSDFSRANFIASHLIDCQFDDVDMGGAVFTECEFIKPKFNKIRFLESLTLSRSKIWNSKKWIEVNAFDNIFKIINELEA